MTLRAKKSTAKSEPPATKASFHGGKDKKGAITFKTFYRRFGVVFPDTDVFIICFALDDRASFDEVEEVWVPEVRQHCPQAEVILLGQCYLH